MTVPDVWWSPSANGLIAAHPHGGCFDVEGAAAAKWENRTHQAVGDLLDARRDMERMRQGMGPDFTERLARALHDADCGCGTYDAVEDPRYITAARAAMETSGGDT